MAMLAINLQSSVDNTTHWPCQNYEKDHEANMGGVRCSSGKEWLRDMHCHSLTECAWMSRTGDVIYSGYEEDTNHGLNVTKSYCELAIKTTYHCIPSWSLLKHGSMPNRIRSSYRHSLGACCKFSKCGCDSYCRSCVHYCGIQHGS